MASEESSSRPAFENAWRKRFEEFATLRDDDAGIAGWSFSGLDARFRRFAGVWQESAHGRFWLDAGCGAGTYSRYLASRGADVVGLDYCLPAVLKAKARAAWSCRWAVADVVRLPLKPGSFDGVLCFGVMQALADSAPTVRELAAQVAEGGEVWLDALNGYCVANALQRLSRWLRGKAPHLRYESPRRMKLLMEEAGLTGVRIHWIAIMPARLKLLQPVAESAVVSSLMKHVPGLGAVLSRSCMLTGRKPESTSLATPSKDPNPPHTPDQGA